MMIAPDIAKSPPPEQRRPSTNPGLLTVTEIALIAHLARACDVLDARLTGAGAPPKEAA